MTIEQLNKIAEEEKKEDKNRRNEEIRQIREDLKKMNIIRENSS